MMCKFLVPLGGREDIGLGLDGHPRVLERGCERVGWVGRGMAFGQGEVPLDLTLRNKNAMSVFCQSSLRLGWPATEWETGPEPKLGEMAGEISLAAPDRG